MGSSAEQKIIGMLDVLSVEVVATRQSVERLEGRVGSLELKFDSLESKVDAGFNRLERRIDKFETRLLAVEADVRDIHSKL